MKRLLSYLIVASFLVACGKKVEIIEPPFVFDDNLLQIDSMMQHDADSALQMLLSFRVERGTSYEFNANYQSLLLSETFYKTYNPQLNRYCSETFQETSLQDAMHYFDEEDLVGQKAKFMGLSCTRLGEVFYNNDIAKASLYFYKNALKHYYVVDVIKATEDGGCIMTGVYLMKLRMSDGKEFSERIVKE